MNKLTVYRIIFKAQFYKIEFRTKTKHIKELQTLCVIEPLCHLAGIPLILWCVLTTQILCVYNE